MTGLLASFDPRFYARIARQPFARSLGFLLLLSLFTAALISFGFSLSLNRQIPGIKSWGRENLEKIAAEIPEIEVHNGTLILPKEKFIKEWQKAEFALIIDPAGDNSAEILGKYRAAVVLNKNRFLTKVEREPGSAEIKAYSLEKIRSLKISSIPQGVRIIADQKDLRITVASVNKWLEIIRVAVFPVMLSLLCSWFYLAKLSQVLFFSLFSLAVNAGLKSGLSYKALLNIGIYAVVAPTLLAVVNLLLNQRIPFFNLIYLLVYLTYLFLGIKAAAVRAQE